MAAFHLFYSLLLAHYPHVMNYFCVLQRRIYDILWQNIFATRTPKHKQRLSNSFALCLRAFVAIFPVNLD